MKTLKYLVGVLAAVAMFGMVSPASAVEAVANTKHDLTSTSTGATTKNTSADTDQVCAFCHTPHGASTTAQPLWNREDQAGGYTMYSSSTIEMTIAATPNGISLACLSCHDGTVALDAFQNTPGSGDSGVTGTEGWTFGGNAPSPANTLTGFANVGIDLSNDHPISVTYNELLDTGFNPPGDLLLAKLFGGSVECSSCHNPHDATYGAFLRADNAGSALCSDCHIK